MIVSYSYHTYSYLQPFRCLNQPNMTAVPTTIIMSVVDGYIHCTQESEIFLSNISPFLIKMEYLNSICARQPASQNHLHIFVVVLQLNIMHIYN